MSLRRLLWLPVALWAISPVNGLARPAKPGAAHKTPAAASAECSPQVKDNFSGIRLGDGLDSVVRVLLEKGYRWQGAWEDGHDLDEYYFARGDFNNDPAEHEQKYASILQGHLKPTQIKRTNDNGSSVFIMALAPNATGAESNVYNDHQFPSGYILRFNKERISDGKIETDNINLVFSAFRHDDNIQDYSSLKLLDLSTRLSFKDDGTQPSETVQQSMREAGQSFVEGLKQRYPHALIYDASSNDVLTCGLAGRNCKKSMVAPEGVMLTLPELDSYSTVYSAGIHVFDHGYKACQLNKVEASYLPYLQQPAPAKMNF